MRSGSFSPGRLSTPEETSTMPAPVRRMASATLSGVSPPDSTNGTSPSIPSSSRQSNGAPLPPGRVLSAGARASNRMRSAAGEKRRAARGVVGRLDRDRLHDGDAPAGADFGHALGRLLPMQLEDVGRDGGDDLVDQRIVRIDHQGHHLGPPARPRRQKLRRCRRDVAWARGEEHEADVVRPARQRRLQRRFGLQAADFDFGRHGAW